MTRFVLADSGNGGFEAGRAQCRNDEREHGQAGADDTDHGEDDPDHAETSEANPGHGEAIGTLLTGAAGGVVGASLEVGHLHIA
jgi:hypothetical protein